MSVVSRSLAALIVIAIVALAAWILQDDPSPLLGQELSPSLSAEDAGIRGLDLDDALPAALPTSLVSDTPTEGRQAVEAKPEDARGSLTGRVLYRVRPCVAARVNVTRVGRRGISGKLFEIERLSTVRTDVNGFFRSPNLVEGEYLVHVEAESYLESQYILVKLAAGEHHNLHDILMRPGSPEKSIGNKPREELPVILHVLADQAGLLVDVYGQSGHRATGIGKVRTDEFGEALVKVHQSGPFRIELRGTSGRVLGGTQSYEHYPRGVESVVRIPSSSGGLKLFLPSGSGVDPGEAMQYILSNNETGEEVSLCETVRGDAPNAKSRGLESTSESLEISELPAVQYAIKALRMVRRDNGRWYPTGDRWHGVAQVRPGETTVCLLN